MLIMRKKVLYTTACALLSIILAFEVKNIFKEKTQETVALPVNKKVIILDARTSEEKTGGATTEDRNIRGRY